MKNARINRKREGEDQVKLLHKALHNAKHTIGDLWARVGHFIEDEDEVHEAAKEFQEIEQEAASTELRDQLSDEQRRAKDLEQQVAQLQEFSVRMTSDGRQVQPWVRLTYMKLLAAGVSAAMCSQVVEIVLKEQPDVRRQSSGKDLPGRKFADSCSHELASVCHIDAAVKIADHAHEPCVLGTDEGSHNQQSSNAIVAHYPDIKSQCLGIDEMATHYAREGAEKVQKRMDKYGGLSQRVSKDLGRIDLTEAERKVVYSVAAFSATITDQCNTQKATNTLIDDIKKVKVGEWNSSANEEEKAKRSPLLDDDMQHIFCYIHAGTNLAAKFDEAFKRLADGSSSHLRANVEDDAEEDNDVEPEAAPDEYEIEAIVASRIRPGVDKEYRVRWKGWSAQYDTWEPASNMLHAAEVHPNPNPKRQP